MARSSGEAAGESRKHKIVRSLSKKAIAPIAASLTAYAVKKFPELLEEKILPKLQERARARGAPQPATASADGAGVVAKSRTTSAVAEDREEARRRREEHRRARRQAAT